MTTTTTITNPLVALEAEGQSVWLDYIRRSLITSGELRRLIDEDGLSGVTSNPAIFEKAITGSTDYTDMLESLAARERDPKAVYEQIAIRDVRDAADVLADVYRQTNRRDGYVSLEVSPLLARESEATVQEARRLWSAVARPNVMIKVPATTEGLVALRRLTADGINVNVTLLFSQERYAQTIEAYMSGLEDRAACGEDISGVASVASFFVSRIDAAVEAAAAQNERARDLLGRIAIANARLAYQHYRRTVEGARWQALAARGAQPQRLLWASTSSKNAQYRDVLYVEELIGPDTVNTIPPATFNAFRDHGRVRASLIDQDDAAAETMASLERAGISIDGITTRLLDEGIELFVGAFDRLMTATGRRLQTRQSVKVDRLTFSLPATEVEAVNASLAEWDANSKVVRLWRGDASIWTSSDEGRWVGWLGIADDQQAHLASLTDFASEIRNGGFSHAVLLGMGGSSLCPEVLRLTFGKIPGYPDLHIVDSTDPAQIRSVEQRIDLAQTLFIVSSKSGGTLEPNILFQYFFDRVSAAVGEQEAGRRFIAITDPGSNMQRVAERHGFRRIFYGLPSIGGRYSALSAFGMVPAAIMGVDLARFLDLTEEMVHACGPTVAAPDNPGVVLGTILGVMATRGCDKVTLVASPAIGDLGAWLEQLLAESTGKNGKALIPIDGEPLAPPQSYGADRLFIYLRLESSSDASQDGAINALETAGRPVVRIDVEEPYRIGEEFFRWEIATAVAGSLIRINPFDQPDVEASKVATRRLTQEYEQAGALPAEQPFAEVDGMSLFADASNTAELERAVTGDRSLSNYLRAHLGRLGTGDYFAVLAYVEMNEEHAQALRRIRQLVRDAARVATCVGFGPRFLHSTGQAYKGGPNTGVFLQLTSDPSNDLRVPGQRYTFGVVKAAQARGDFQVLSERGRRALRVHLGSDVDGGLKRLEAAFNDAFNGRP